MKHISILFASVVAASSVAAAEIKVLSAGAVEPGLRAFAQLVKAQTGHDLAIQYNTAPRIAERLTAGETFDILISPPAVIAQPKSTRYPDGAAVMEHVLKTKGNVLGFGAITEIRQYEAKGLRLVGPLPSDLQNYTNYDAALMTGAGATGPAQAALALLATPAGKAAFASAGVE